MKQPVEGTLLDATADTLIMLEPSGAVQTYSRKFYRLPLELAPVVSTDPHPVKLSGDLHAILVPAR